MERLERALDELEGARAEAMAEAEAARQECAHKEGMLAFVEKEVHSVKALFTEQERGLREQMRQLTTESESQGARRSRPPQPRPRTRTHTLPTHPRDAHARTHARARTHVHTHARTHPRTPSYIPARALPSSTRPPALPSLRPHTPHSHLPPPTAACSARGPAGSAGGAGGGQQASRPGGGGGPSSGRDRGWCSGVASRA